MRDSIWELRAEVERLRRRVEQRPVLQTAVTLPAYRLITIDKGNTLETGQDGILYQASVTSVPSVYDPNVTSSFVDGIGRGTLYINGVAQTGYVLVVNSDQGSFRNAMFHNDVFVSTGSVRISAGGTDFVICYTV